MTTTIPYEIIRKHVPMIAVDGLIIEKDRLLLIKRATNPFKDHWALPGGFVELNETLEHAITREIKEETDLNTEVKKLLGAYSRPDRDPRGHTISIIYLMKIISGTPKSTEEAKETRYFKIDNLPENIAFDHKKIIENAKQIIDNKKTSDKNL